MDEINVEEFLPVRKTTPNFAYDRVLDVDLCQVREERTAQGYACEKLFKADSMFGVIFTITWKKKADYVDPAQGEIPGLSDLV